MLQEQEPCCSFIPNMAAYFEPTASYTVFSSTGVQINVPNSKVRRQAFGSKFPIVFPDGATGLSTVLSAGNTRNASNIETTYPNGEPDKWEKTSQGLKLQYTAGDPLSSLAARVQLTTWPVRPGLWEFDYIFKLGDLEVPWAMLANGVSPAILWQLKPTDGQPSWNLSCDTASDDSSKLALTLTRRQTLGGGNTVVNRTNFDPTQVFHMNILIGLSYTTDGWISYKINGKQLYTTTGISTLNEDSTSYPQPFFGMYMYNNTDLDLSPSPTRRMYVQRYMNIDKVNPGRTI